MTDVTTPTAPQEKPDRPLYGLLTLLGTIAATATLIIAVLFKPFPPGALALPLFWGSCRVAVWTLRLLVDRTMTLYESIMAAIGIAVLIGAFKYLADIAAR